MMLGEFANLSPMAQPTSLHGQKSKRGRCSAWPPTIAATTKPLIGPTSSRNRERGPQPGERGALASCASSSPLPEVRGVAPCWEPIGRWASWPGMRCRPGCNASVAAAWLATGPVLNARVRPWRVALRGETSAIDEGPKTEADAAGPRESRLCRVKGRPPAVYRLRRGARSFFFIHEMTALVRSLPRSA